MQNALNTFNLEGDVIQSFFGKWILMFISIVRTLHKVLPH
jgi:hypothetical protein